MGFEKLEKRLEEIEGIYCKIYNIPKISDLTNERRKSELSYLRAILNSVMNDTSDKEELTNAYYGAMIVAREDSRDLTGTLATNLAQDLGITPENPNLNLFFETRCIISLNKHLRNRLFDGNTPPKIRQDHLLKGLDLSESPIKNMSRLVELGLTLENVKQKQLLESMKTGNIFSKKEDHISKGFSETTLLPFLSWQELKTKLDKIIETECTQSPKYGNGIFGIGHAGSIQNLSPRRQTHLYYLLTLRELLDKSTFSEAHKKATFIGAMLIIKQQISLERGITSKVYDALDAFFPTDISMNLPGNVEKLLQAANQFTRCVTMHIPSPEEQRQGIPRIFKEQNPFSKISGFKPREILSLYQDMIYECRKASFTEQAKLFQESILAQNPPSQGIFGSLMGLFSSSTQPIAAAAAAAPAEQSKAYK